MILTDQAIKMAYIHKIFDFFFKVSLFNLKQVNSINFIVKFV